jgi:hypothetical protein
MILMMVYQKMSFVFLSEPLCLRVSVAEDKVFHP